MLKKTIFNLYYVNNIIIERFKTLSTITNPLVQEWVDNNINKLLAIKNDNLTEAGKLKREMFLSVKKNKEVQKNVRPINQLLAIQLLFAPPKLKEELIMLINDFYEKLHINIENQFLSYLSETLYSRKEQGETNWISESKNIPEA